MVLRCPGQRKLTKHHQLVHLRREQGEAESRIQFAAIHPLRTPDSTAPCRSTPVGAPQWTFCSPGDRASRLWTTVRPRPHCPIFLATLAVRQQSQTIRFKSGVEMLDTFGMQKRRQGISTARCRVRADLRRHNLFGNGYRDGPGSSCSHGALRFLARGANLVQPPQCRQDPAEV